MLIYEKWAFDTNYEEVLIVKHCQKSLEIYILLCLVN